MTSSSNPPSLSADDRAAWERDGFLTVEGLFDRDELAGLRRAAEAVLEGSPGSRRTFIIGATDAFDALIDHVGIFPRLVALMGVYIQLAGSEVVRREPATAPLSWRVDRDPALQPFQSRTDMPELRVEVQVQLTDTDDADPGALLVIPGSHRGHATLADLDASQARPLLVRAGDVAIFPPTLVHAQPANVGARPQLSLILRYAQLWCRPYDYEIAPAELLARMTQRRRLLLGDRTQLTEPYDYYYPPEGLHDDMAGG